MLRKKMHENCKIIFLVFIIFGESTLASTGDYLPFSGKHQIPSKTPEPINIISARTHPLSTHKPLILEGNLGHEKAYLRNTGTVVKVDLIQENTTNVIFGGPLGNDIYVYTETKFYYSINGVAYTTVDGKGGTALEVAIIYYNLKYESHYKALNYRDGIVEVLFRIEIGSKFNPDFEKFAKALKQILNPGEPVEIKLYDSFSWFYNFSSHAGYFAFPGSQTNETLGEVFYCSTSIAVDRQPTQYISKKQFEKTFSMVLEKDGQPLTNHPKQHPQGSRPVVRGRGIIKKFSKKIYRSVV